MIPMNELGGVGEVLAVVLLIEVFAAALVTPVWSGRVLCSSHRACLVSP